MRALRILILSGWAVIGGAIAGQANLNVDNLLLTPDEVKPSCEMITGEHPVRKETQTFYEQGINSELLPLVLNKRLQSFRCGKQKGTLYYFEYTDIPEREKAEVYARTTLWGGGKAPTPKYPDQIFHSDRFLMILSFKDIQRELLAALLKRIKAQGVAMPAK